MIADERDPRIAAARRAADEISRGPGVLGVYLTGSLAAGLGNTRSDVDLTVLTEDRETSARRQFHVDGIRVDVQSATMGEIQDLSRRLSGGVVAAARGELSRLEAELEFLTRFLDGCSFYETPRGAALYAETAGKRGAVRRLAVARFTALAASRYEDLIGCVEIGDQQTGLMLSAEILARALHVFLIGADDLYVGEKWVWQKLERTASALPASSVRDLYFNPADDAGAAIGARISMAQALFVAAQVNERRRSPGEWGNWWVGAEPEGEIRRCLDGFPLVFDDVIVMERFDGGWYPMTLAELVQWGVCGGTSRTTVERSRSAPEFARSSARQTAECLQNMVRRKEVHVRIASQ